MCHQYIENDINEMRNLEIKICIEYLFWYILLEIFEVTFYEVTRRHGCSPVNFQNTFFQEHLWEATSDDHYIGNDKHF